MRDWGPVGEREGVGVGFEATRGGSQKGERCAPFSVSEGAKGKLDVRAQENKPTRDPSPPHRHPRVESQSHLENENPKERSVWTAGDRLFPVQLMGKPVPGSP